MREIERFQAAVRTSPELADGLKTASFPADCVAYASTHGFNFSATELETWSKPKMAGELSTSDLDRVFGGQAATTGSNAKGTVGDAILYAWYRVFYY